MNTIQTIHPTHENLAAFNAGRLGVLESAEIERHLADCEPCCRLLKTLPDETLVSLLGPQSDTKSESTPSGAPAQPLQPRPALDVTIAPGECKTQTDAKPITPSSADAPAELQNHPRYRIESLLGRGGMGSVYQAQHRLMNRPVALKVIDRQLVQTPGLVERFHREVQAAAKLAHPNIVTAYDAEQAGDLHFLVMELVEGQDLAEIVRQRGKLPIQEACEYVRQAAQGLQHACERGMVHRDIKPQNLMLQASPDASAPASPVASAPASPVASAPVVIKILDFGLAQFATEIAETSGLTQVGAMMGTPDYMAPEQARDAHSADIRADIYSLGCTLYCLLSGGAPFPQGSIVEKVMAHVERQPLPLQELRDDVPPKLAAVLAKMMAKSPLDRFQTPAEVAEALLPFASSGPTKTPVEVLSPIPKATARQPRSPLFIATSVLGVLATVILLGVLVIVTDQGRIEVRSEVDDVELVVKRGGEQIDILDAQTGSKVKWYYSGKFDLELKGNRNDIVIHNDGFQLTRWGKQIVTLTRKTEGLAGGKPESPVIGGYAMDFDGKRANVRVATGKPSKAETLTVEGWLKPTGRGTYQYREIPWSGHVYRNDSSEGQTAMGLAYEEQEDGSQRWVLRIIAQEEFTAITSKDKCEFGKWTHVAAVIADKKMSLFVDGRQQGDSLPISGFTDVQYSPFKLAGDSVVKGSFVGQFHMVRISTVARYDKDFKPQTRFERDKDTAALYQFGEGTGNVLKDSSGNGNNGWMVGAKWVEVEVTEVAGGQITGVTPPAAVAPFNAEQAKQHQEAWAKHLGVPVEYTNSIGMKFRLIPPGEFTIGSTPEEIAEALKNVGDAVDQSSQFARDCAKSEGPQHKVILTLPRYLGVHEVTQSQYEKIMGKNPSHFAAAGPGKEAVIGLDTANHPVEFVSWNEAVVFCAKLSQLENLPADNRQLDDAKTRLGSFGYRLPTEAEWEFACRAGTTTKFLSGNGDEHLDQTAWIGRNSGLRTHAAGELLANPFGLHDLQGNVWEWCHDLWELTYYNRFLEQPALDPSGPLPPGDDHLLRGGAWNGQPYHCRASFHHHMVSQYRDSTLGFRASLSVEAVKMAIKKPAIEIPVVPTETNLITDPSFIILAKESNAERTFYSLLEAVEAAKDRDTIEIRGNGPFVIPPVVSEAALTIRAARGFRPVLQSMSTADKRGGLFLIRSNAPLTLEGLELHHRHEAFVPNSCVLWSEGGPLYLANCRIVRGGAGFRTIFSNSAVVEARNCEFLTEPGSDIDTQFWSTLHAKGKFVLDNNIVVAGNSGVCLVCNQPSLEGCDVRLDRNTFLAKRAVSFALDAVPEKALAVAAVGNVFDTRLTAAQLWFTPVFVAREKAPSLEETQVAVPNILAWQDKDNLYVPLATVLTVSVHGNADEHPIAGKGKLPEWTAKSSHEGRVRYRRAGLLGKASLSAVLLTSDDFRLASGSPGQGVLPGGKDIGADIDLVGPGPAYEKWQTTPEYLEWLKRSGQPAVLRQAPKKPAAPVIPANGPAVPIGKNLITDPSLEATAIGEKFPTGWGSGNLIPPGAYKFSVAEGGKTGKRGWLIEGDGQYAVVPTNRPGVDRALRYGARGWVRLEAGSAQLKILYFDGNGRYLGENRSAITNKRDGWHQLTMLDDLAKWPEARHLSLALTLIGKGKAVFDDLEFTAFDAQKLPANFEKDYASTPKHDPSLFDRWAGRWETTTEYKATAVTPAKTMKGETIVRKVLDDQFLLWQWKDESGDSQYLSLLGFDENTGNYRFWVFGSTGEVFERSGQWDEASQTLSLDVKATSPGITGISTDRFADKDRLESMLLVKNAGGQITRDMRAIWARKAVPLPADIDLSDGPAVGSAELSLLQKMAGDWTIRSTAKPSVWEPRGKTETFTEQVAWTSGGRFLVFRAYDEKKQMTSLSLMTYEPKESSYHFWTFAKGVYGGQWRITWDASSRAFHWRSVDMPAGWVGTGYNRWVDDDTFDNQALIKDENGRVLLDTTQEKRRKK